MTRFAVPTWVVLCLWAATSRAEDAASGAVAPPVAASSQPEDDRERVDLNDLLNIKVEVTARQEESIFAADSDVVVIDRKTIELYGFRNVAEALDSVSGVMIERTYFKRDIPTLGGVLQSNYANKVLTLINGVPNWMAVSGEGSIDRLDIHDIERIEVLKGPASVLYGTNAFAGAINFVLRTGLNDRGEVYGRAGSATLIQGGGHFTHALGDFKISGFANGGYNAGTTSFFRDPTGTQGDVKDYVRQNNVSLVGEYDGGHHHHSLLFNGFANQESFLGVAATYATGAGMPAQVGGYLGSYTYRYTSEKVDAEAGFSYDYQARSFSRNATDSQRSDVSGQRFTLFERTYYRPLPYLSLEAGVDTDLRNAIQLEYVYDSRNLQPAQPGFKQQYWMRESSVYAQAKFSLSTLLPNVPLTALFGIRYTNNEYFNGYTSGRATLTYRLAPTHSIKLIGAQSFRAPTLYELYFTPLLNTVYGNHDLLPEKSSSLQLTYVGGVGKFFATVSGHITSYDDLIFRGVNPTDPTGISRRFENGKRLVAKGYDLDLKYQDPAILNAYLGFSYVDGEDAEQGALGNQYNFYYVPKAILSAGASRSIGNFSISATMKFIGLQHTNGAPLPPQAILNANMGYQWGRTHHRIVLENAFNHPFQFAEFVRGSSLTSVPSGYGRRIYYMFEYEFF